MAAIRRIITLPPPIPSSCEQAYAYQLMRNGEVLQVVIKIRNLEPDPKVVLENPAVEAPASTSPTDKRRHSARLFVRQEGIGLTTISESLKTHFKSILIHVGLAADFLIDAEFAIMVTINDLPEREPLRRVRALTLEKNSLSEKP